MTKTMEKAIEKLRGLPEARQETFARFLLHELDSDTQWEATTAAHIGNVAKLVQDVLAADQRDETETLDADKL